MAAHGFNLLLAGLFSSSFDIMLHCNKQGRKKHSPSVPVRYWRYAGTIFIYNVAVPYGGLTVTVDIRGVGLMTIHLLLAPMDSNDGTIVFRFAKSAFD